MVENRLTGVSLVSVPGSVPVPILCIKKPNNCILIALELMEEVAKRVEVKAFKHGGIWTQQRLLGYRSHDYDKCQIP